MITLFVGKSAKPRCFKNMNMDSLPVKYYTQRSAWMNGDIFKEWYHKVFVTEVKRYQDGKGLQTKKALLLLGNAPSYPDSSSLTNGSITAMFLPPNTTPLIQPMEQGVLESLKGDI